MPLPAMDLGLSTIIYQSTEEYKFTPKPRNQTARRQRTKQKVKWQITVAGFLAITGVAAATLIVARFTPKGGSYADGIMALLEYITTRLEQIIPGLPDLPKIPSLPNPGGVVDAIKGGLSAINPFD